jgi:hypothetical protein
MLEAFRIGGWGMIPTFICGLLMVIVSVRYAARPDRRFVPLVISLNVLTSIAGLLGFVTGLIIEPSVALVGLGESLYNVALALMLMMVAAIAAALGAFRLSRSASEVPRVA